MTQDKSVPTTLAALQSLDRPDSLGWVVSWSIGAVMLSHTDLEAKMLKHNLDKSYVPKAIRARSAFDRTRKDLEEDGLAYKLQESTAEAIYVLLDPHVDMTQEDVDFQKRYTVTYNKEKKTVTASDPTQQKKVDDLMAQYGQNFLSRDVRTVVLDVVKDACKALTLRDRGGVYFVASARRDNLRNVVNFVNDLGPTCDIMALSVPQGSDAVGDKGQIFKSFEKEFIGDLETLAAELDSLELSGKGTIEVFKGGSVVTAKAEFGLVEFTGVAGGGGVIDHHVQAGDTLTITDAQGIDHVYNVVRTVNDNSLVVSNTKLESTGQFVITRESAEGSKTRQSTWLRRLDSFKKQKEKALMFSELLEIQAEEYVTRVKALEERVRAKLS